jgi:hypothetical protein
MYKSAQGDLHDQRKIKRTDDFLALLLRVLRAFTSFSVITPRKFIQYNISGLVLSHLRWLRRDSLPKMGSVT